ncbi:MAG TPA: sigma-70 family RNA polymerase sigma factor [Clostridia bacterium]|nr:sigma-70 family RNA polymerase sigma factor [Clostridia bacterium]
MNENRDFLSIVDAYKFFILRIVKSKISYVKEDIEDVYQEIITKIYNSKDSLDYGKNPKAWICTIALNECRNWYRKSQSYRNSVSFDALDNCCNLYSSVDPVEKQQLYEAVNSLNDADKKLLLLKNHYGYTYKEISEKFLTEMSTDQLKNRCCYVRKNLKTHF